MMTKNTVCLSGFHIPFALFIADSGCLGKWSTQDLSDAPALPMPAAHSKVLGAMQKLSK